MTNAMPFSMSTFQDLSKTPRTPQCEVVWALLSSSEHSGVPEDSKSPTLQVLGFTPTLGQSGVATLKVAMTQDKVNKNLVKVIDVIIRSLLEKLHPKTMETPKAIKTLMLDPFLRKEGKFKKVKEWFPLLETYFKT
jgi:hypothetical protein